MVLTNTSYFVNGMAFMFFLTASIRILAHKNRNRLFTILGVILAFWALLLLKDLFFNVHQSESLLLRHTILVIDGWAVPASSFYLFELIKPGSMNIKKVALVLIPFIILTSAFVIVPSLALFEYYWLFIILYGIATVGVLFSLGKKYSKHIKDNYSFSENIGLSWLNRSTLILITCFIVWITIYLLGESQWGDIIYYLTSIIFWSYILYNTSKLIRVEVPDKELEEVSSEESEEKDEEKEEDHIFSNSFIELLNKAMEEDKLYLNPRLTITDLANAIGTNRTYLSHYINSTMQTSFYDYVNNYRIENTSKLLLLTINPMFTIDEIAEQSGFNSVSTFRRAFQKNTGMTPQQFRKSLL